MTAPITLVALGGYLGAGKTTLLNELLSSTGDERVAVIINDFGEVNIDAQLVRSRSADTLELSNGCVCCSLVDGMTATIERVRAMRPAPGFTVVEVSGVGDPAAVAAWGDVPGFRRGGAVVCVDPGTIERHAADRWIADTVQQQLQGADALLLTKTDLRPAADVARVRSWLQSAAPGARVVHRADLKTSWRRGFARTRRLPGGATPHRPDTASAHVERHTAWTVTFTAPVTDLDLLRALRNLPEVVERVKGVVPIASADGPRRVVLNHAGGDFTLLDEGGWDGTPGRLVLIAPLPQDEVTDPTDELSALAGGRKD